jgi:tellurite resistance protein TerC
MEVSLSFWVVFHLVIAVFLAIDLIYWERKKGEIRFRDSLLWVIVWISLGLSFSVIIFSMYGTEEFIKYITAYITEYSLSTDNLFVFLVIFTYFAVPPTGRHIGLLIGILLSIVLRASFIFIGIALLERFHWMIYVFGAILIYTGYKMAKGGGEAVDPGKNKAVIFARKFLPIVPTYDKDGKSFIIKQNGNTFFTPLILAILAIGTTDIMFAFDSVPAVLAITREFFTAYTSNIMAVLGLRSLYFLLEYGLRLVENLGKGLAIYLVYLGAAFILSAFGIKVPSYISLLLIATIILVLVLMARLRRKESGTTE